MSEKQKKPAGRRGKTNMRPQIPAGLAAKIAAVAGFEEKSSTDVVIDALENWLRRNRYKGVLAALEERQAADAAKAKEGGER